MNFKKLLDPKSSYTSRLIEDNPPIDALAEKDLLLKAKSGDDESLARLVYSNIRLVMGKTRELFRERGEISYEDLLQEGLLGFLQAIKRFDLSRNVRLSTYAEYWIREQIGEAYKNLGTAVRIPIEMQNSVNKELLPFIEEREKQGLTTTREDVLRERPELLTEFKAYRLRLPQRDEESQNSTREVRTKFRNGSYKSPELEDTPDFNTLLDGVLSPLERSVLTIRIVQETDLNDAVTKINSLDMGKPVNRTELRMIEMEALRKLEAAHPEYKKYL